MMHHMNTNEVLKLALEALGQLWLFGDEAAVIANPAITALREALAEKPAQQQEPVAWLVCENWRKHSLFFTEEGAEDFKNAAQREDDLSGNLARWKAKPLYASPPAQRTWVGLTDKEIEDAWPFVWRTHESVRHFAIYHAIEAKLRQKNT